MKKVVSYQIKDHIHKFALDNPYQSAYKAFHSTETALVTVQNEVIEDMEKGEVTALTLLDLSAAFDTIDHDLLLNRLTDWFRIGGNALSWLNSYLRDKFQCVNINGTISNPFELLFGVPQGSVLGPLLFIVYTTPLSSVLTKFYHLNHHLYADDTQLLNSFTTFNCNINLTNLHNSLLSAQNWMYSNKLKLNPDKTEFMLISNKRQWQKFDSKFPLELIGSKLSPATTARNLGVIFDQDFNFKNHKNNIVKNCFYNMCHLRCICKHLDIGTATAPANALAAAELSTAIRSYTLFPNFICKNSVFKMLLLESLLTPVVTPVLLNSSKNFTGSQSVPTYISR